MNKKMYTKCFFSALLLIFSSSYFSVQAEPFTLNLESGINGNTYTVQGETGTAGILGIHYELGSYLVGGNGGLGHGFSNILAWEPGFVVPTPPSGETAEGALEATDHNWLQSETTPIIVDLGVGSEQAIVFSSIDHLGVDTFYDDPEMDLWNKFVEAIEFTVYGTNNLADALDAGVTTDVFGTVEAGSIPDTGVGSSFEQATLDYVFEDGWFDYGNIDEGDDYASIWQFTQAYRYIGVYSNFTDPIIDDGFRSSDSELDAIGRFIPPEPPTRVPEPNYLVLLAIGLALFGIYRRYRSKEGWKVISDVA